jgi:hypothetical protein
MEDLRSNIMCSPMPEKGNDKFNFYTAEEIKKAISELEEVKKQIDKRTEQLKKMSETSIDKKISTIPGTLNFKDIDPQK